MWGAEIVSQRKKPDDVGKLQRGRALWGAEISSFAPGSFGNAQASTGPRLVGRGNPPGTHCMNTFPPGFNGAAPCGARKYDGRIDGWMALHWLQRGRALWGAEICKHSSGHDYLHVSLQRGRALWGAEISTGKRKWWRTAGLQRGRALWGAEIVMKPRNRMKGIFCFNGAAPCGARKWDIGGVDSTPAIVSFNGAAPCGARKLCRCWRNAPRMESLQRGRALWGAEIRHKLHATARAGDASTGPRLVGRGNG